MKPTLAYFALYRNRFKFYKIHDISSHEWKHYNDFLWNNFMCVILVFIWRPAGFGDFRAKTIGFHVTLRTRRTWLCERVTRTPKVVVICSKAQKTRQVF